MESNKGTIIDDAIKVYFPNLDEKEFIVCKFIVMAP
jgi:hypothetical protein